MASIFKNVRTEAFRPGLVVGIYLCLGVLTWCVFGQTVQHDFVQYDDPGYVYENPDINAGITAHGVIAAFTHTHARNWHPLTTISHMLDCQLFGLDPAGHHLVNVLLHALAVLLLFSVLNGMTGAVWPSAFVAAVFAIHPLRAESVAWISERKDVLSGVFFMLTLGAYVRYVRDQRLGRYLVTAVFFVFALMSKPTVVMLPVLLLLLDFWPLNRFRAEFDVQSADPGSISARALAFVRSRIFLEKIPLILLSVGAGIATLMAQRQTVQYGHGLSFAGRISNAVLSCVIYLQQTIWPHNLAAFYPDLSDRVSIGAVILSALLLVGITGLAFWMRRRHPCLTVGWCWYLVSLLPVIGIVQVGIQGRADRYTYLPQLGVGIAIAWTVAELPGRNSRAWRGSFAIVAVLIVALLARLAAIQAGFWKDSESLWTHALSVNDSNDIAHNNIAARLLTDGKFDEAIAHYQAALRASSPSETHNHLSPAILENSLGNAFARKGDLNSAATHYQKAVELNPVYSDAGSNLAAVLFTKGDIPAAIAAYEKVISIPPEDALSHQRLASLLLRADRATEAIAHYRRALELDPQSWEALRGLAWILATASDPTVKNGSESFSLARRANDLTHGKDPLMLRTLAASYAACGDFREAVQTSEFARSLAGNDVTLSATLEADIKTYRMAVSRIVSSRARR
ncbi:MAG TPA: tetratricopeptide repeat protein [Chthoniobacterales bacterium]|jgi:tetratricopeptide (TPR) repeat protein